MVCKLTVVFHSVRLVGRVVLPFRFKASAVSHPHAILSPLDYILCIFLFIFILFRTVKWSSSTHRFRISTSTQALSFVGSCRATYTVKAHFHDAIFVLDLQNDCVCFYLQGCYRISDLPLWPNSVAVVQGPSPRKVRAKSFPMQVTCTLKTVVC